MDTNTSVRIKLFAASLLALSASGVLSASEPHRLNEGIDDPLATSYITPTRIVWMSDHSGTNIRSSEVLLNDFSGQVAVSSRGTCVLSTVGGGEAALLLDFGKEYQGGIEIAAAVRNNQKPVRVRVRYGESVSEAMSEADGTATNDHAMRDFEIEIPWLGSVRTGESGFRFVRIDLLDSDTELHLSGVRLVFRYRDIPYLGSFKCSDQRLNDIWQTGAYTVHLNMQSHLWDGIKRDRLVWLGDLHPEVMCVNTVFGDNEVVAKSLDFARDDTPLPGWMNGMVSYSMWWIIIHKDLYIYNGNMAYLREQLPYLKGLAEQVIAGVKGRREEHNGGIRFLDWPTSEMEGVIHAGLQSLTVMAIDAARQIAIWLGDKGLEKTAAKALKDMEGYIPADDGNKQAAAMLAVAGLLDADKAAAIITRDGAHGFATFYGYYMLEALALAGKHEAAVKIISDYWGAMLDLGATTFWEDLDYADALRAARIDELVPEGVFDIHADGGAYCYVGLRHSFCHGWASGPTSWITNHVLGIRPIAPGCAKVEIKPNLSSLDWAEGTLPTPHGEIFVRHEKRPDGTVQTTVKAPKQIKIIKQTRQ